MRKRGPEELRNREDTGKWTAGERGHPEKDKKGEDKRKRRIVEKRDKYARGKSAKTERWKEKDIYQKRKESAKTECWKEEDKCQKKEKSEKKETLERGG